MTGAQKLAAALRPLGVYNLRPESFSGAELEALGAGLDTAAQALDTALQDSCPLRAQGSALAALEALFPMRSGGTPDERRLSLAGFWQVREDSFTQAALNACLSACGLPCRVEETGTPGCVEITFPTVRGEPDGFAHIRAIAEMILPCHLGISYRFMWCTWGETEDWGLTWGDLEEGTWEDWTLRSGV